MSSKLRKLAKRINFQQVQVSNIKHGCEECRSIQFRQQLTREIVAKRLVQSPPTLVCPMCGAAWKVSFGADAEGMALVSFQKAVLS